MSDHYVCVGCGKPLIAKTRAEKREKHFAHKVVNPACTEETYLHLLAKHVFLAEYKACVAHNIPFLIELTYPKRCSKYAKLLGKSCELGTMTKTHDLTDCYDAIRLEERDGQFIPDLLLYSSTDEARKIYVEIAVTHFLSEEKQQSSHHIIEIPIESEADIEKIRQRRLTEAEASFVNFRRQPAPVTDAECTCRLVPHACLFIYESGKSILLDASLGEIQAKYQRNASKIRYARLSGSVDSFGWNKGYEFVRLIREAYIRGFPVRNCLLCRYAGDNWGLDSEEPVFCKYLKKPCGSNEAAGCRSYRPRPKSEFKEA